ncbi:21618_t:CDS:2, partial [Gigaspora margarita]
PNGNKVLGCVSATVGILEQNSSESFLSLYNVSFAIIVAFIVISFVFTQTGGIQSHPQRGRKLNPTNHSSSIHLDLTSNSSSTHLDPTTAVYNPANGTTTSRSIPTITQAPSIFDIFNAAQFFMTTALVSLSNISFNYWNLASKLSLLNRSAFKTSAHTFIYDPFYNQYRDDPNNPELKNNRVWFFIFKVSYDFIRAIITGVAQQSGMIQTM